MLWTLLIGAHSDQHVSFRHLVARVRSNRRLVYLTRVQRPAIPGSIQVATWMNYHHWSTAGQRPSCIVDIRLVITGVNGLGLGGSWTRSGVSEGVFT